MTLPIVIAGVFCAWAMLRVIGGQRQHQLHELQSRLEAEFEEQAQAPATRNPPATHNPGPTSAVRSKAGR